MTKLSVILATRNEEANIGRCLESVKNIADEIVIADEHSTDKTVEIAKSYGARVFDVDHEDNFHITKKKASDKATGEWVLQLDADEVVSPPLAMEIKDVLKMSDEEILKRRPKDAKLWRLFQRHQEKVFQRDNIRNTGDQVVAFFNPRLNFFLGKPMRHSGVYPDGVIRLFKKDKAYIPADNVHEQIKFDGKVAWLFSNLEHHDSPTFARYVARLNRYTDLSAQELKNKGVRKSAWGLFYYTFIKMPLVFLKIYFLHKGYKDGEHGFIWAFFSASHFPISFYKLFTQ